MALILGTLDASVDPFTTSNFFSQSDIEEVRVWIQLTLPPKLGGFGIIDPIESNYPAYLGAQAAVSKQKVHLQKMINKFRDLNITDNFTNNQPTVITNEEVLANCSNEFIQAFYQFKPLYSAVANDETFNLSTLLQETNKGKRIQHYLTTIVNESKIELINHWWTKDDINRINSCSKEGSIIITALPTHKDHIINGTYVFRERLLLRAGLPYFAIPTGDCLCGNHSKYVDSHGFHLLSGCNKGNLRQTVHNALRDAVADMCSMAGLITNTEASDLLKLGNPNTKQRIDISADNYLPGKSLNIDTSITDPRQVKYSVRVQAVPPGQPSSDREDEKRNKYLNQFTSLNSLFEPFIVETFGRWGKSTVHLFKELVDRVSTISRTKGFFFHKSYISHKWKCKINMAMHRAACYGIHSRIEELVRRRKRNSDDSRMDYVCDTCNFM
jgi:hypothetical protein